MSTDVKAFHIATGNGNSVWMNGDLYSVLVSPCVAQGQISILEASIPPGVARQDTTILMKMKFSM